MPATPGHRPPAEPFTIRDFQLVLLRRMADFTPDLAEDARRALGASAAQQREANRRFQAMRRAPGAFPSVARYRSVLGAPEEVVTRRVGDLVCEAPRWRLPLWPELRFEVLTGPGGQIWNEWLVRAPGAEPPALHTLDDLRPWSCTLAEVSDAFPPARPLEGSAPSRWGLAFTAPDGRGVPRAVTAEFTWGLLQRWSGEGG